MTYIVIALLILQALFDAALLGLALATFLTWRRIAAKNSGANAQLVTALITLADHFKTSTEFAH